MIIFLPSLSRRKVASYFDLPLLALLTLRSIRPLVNKFVVGGNDVFFSFLLLCKLLFWNHNISLLNKFFLSESKSYIFIYIFIRLLSVCFNHRFNVALHLCFCIDLVSKSVIFLLYRHFIENKYRYIKLTAVIIFTAILTLFAPLLDLYFGQKTTIAL